MVLLLQLLMMTGIEGCGVDVASPAEPMCDKVSSQSSGIEKGRPFGKEVLV